MITNQVLASKQTGQIDYQRIKSERQLDKKPKVLNNGNGSVKILYPIYLEDKMLWLLLKKPKRIVVGAFSTEPLANKTMDYFERKYGKKEFYKRKLRMDKPFGVYQS